MFTWIKKAVRKVTNFIGKLIKPAVKITIAAIVVEAIYFTVANWTGIVFVIAVMVKTISSVMSLKNNEIQALAVKFYKLPV